MIEIFVVGYPKSGNTWLSRLLGDILNCPVESGLEHASLADEGHGRPRSFIVRQRHVGYADSQGTLLGDEQVVFLYRDPRDVTLSIQHYWQVDSVEAVLRNSWDRPPNPYNTWPDFMEQWFDSNKVDAFMSYEFMLADTEGAIKITLDNLNISYNHDRILSAVPRQAFHNRKATIQHGRSDRLPYGKEVQLRNLNRGEAGRWRKYWKRHHGELVHEVWTPWLIKLGYEMSEDWWKELPVDGNQQTV